MNKKENTACFTGHRPQKLPWKFKENDIDCIVMKEVTKIEIENAIINYGITHFISGMALGFDMIAAQLVLELKKEYSYVTLECALPCKDQDRLWQEKQKETYKNILSSCDKITYVSNKAYFDGCMKQRNEYMIDNSSMLIALFNGKSGGTKQTIDYARSKGLKIEIIEP